MSLTDQNEQIAEAAEMNLRPGLTDDEAARATENRYIRMWRAVANPAVDKTPDIVQEQESSTTLWASISKIFRAIWGPIAGFVTSQNSISAGFAYEDALDSMYKVRPGEKGYAVDMTGLSAPDRYDETYVPVAQRDKLADASTTFGNQFPEAATGQQTNLDPTIVPEVTPRR